MEQHTTRFRTRSTQTTLKDTKKSAETATKNNNNTGSKATGKGKHSKSRAEMPRATRRKSIDGKPNSRKGHHRKTSACCECRRSHKRCIHALPDFSEEPKVQVTETTQENEAMEDDCSVEVLIAVPERVRRWVEHSTAEASYVENYQEILEPETQEFDNKKAFKPLKEELSMFNPLRIGFDETFGFLDVTKQHREAHTKFFELSNRQISRCKVKAWLKTIEYPEHVTPVLGITVAPHEIIDRPGNDIFGMASGFRLAGASNNEGDPMVVDTPEDGLDKHVAQSWEEHPQMRAVWAGFDSKFKRPAEEGETPEMLERRKRRCE